VDDLDLAIVDVETTGVSPSSDRVMEVAVVRVGRGRVVEKFSSLVDPERRLSHRIWSLTGITDEDLRGAPLFRRIKDDLLRLLEGLILVGELGAIFRQSLLVMELSPAFNRRPLTRPAFRERKGAWPFPGPVAIDERNETTHEGEVFVIDRWGLAAHLAYDDYGMRKVSTKADLPDHDVYPTLVRHLKGSRIARARAIGTSELDRMLDNFSGRLDFSSEARQSGEAPPAMPPEGVLN